MFNICLRAITGGTWSTGDSLAVVGNVCFIIDQIRVLPLNDVWFGVPFRLFPYCHVISVWRDVVWVIKSYILTALFLFLLFLLLGFLLLRFLWHFGLVATPAVVAQDEAEYHQGKDGGTAANNSRNCPNGKNYCLCCRAWAADKCSIVGCLADSTLRALDTQTGHQGLTILSCVELRADTGET